MESYKNAKLKLFTRMKGYEKKFSIINADDKWAEFFIAEAGETV
jgi:UDP-N-acetylmuramyl tripeptide synthase